MLEKIVMQESSVKPRNHLQTYGIKISSEPLANLYARDHPAAHRMMFPKLARTSRQGARLGTKQGRAFLERNYVGPGPRGGGIHLPHVAYGSESAARFYVDAALDNHQPEYTSTKMLPPHIKRQRLGRRRGKPRSKTHLGFTV